MTLLLLNYHVTNDEGVATSGTTSGKGSRLVLTRRWCSANIVICSSSDRKLMSQLNFTSEGFETVANCSGDACLSFPLGI